MAGGLTDLFQALTMFKQGVKDLGQSAAIHDASNKVAEIQKGVDEKTGEALTEAQQFQQLQQVGKTLATNLFAGGAPATTVQTLLNQFGTGATTPEALITQGAMAGGKEAKLGAYQIQLGQEAIKARDQIKLDMISQRVGQQGEQKALDRQARMDIAKMRAQTGGKLTGTALNEVVDGVEQEVRISRLEPKLQSIKPGTSIFNRIKGVSIASALADPNVGATIAELQQFGSAYVKYFSGLASPGKEREALLAQTINEKDSVELAMKKLEMMKSLGKSLLDSKLETYGTLGYNVQGLIDKRKAIAPVTDGFTTKVFKDPASGRVIEQRTYQDGKVMRRFKN